MSAPPRIVSLLPSATEMVYALGLGERLVAVSHECDFPAAARALPKVVKNRFPTERMSGAEIDRKVREAMKAGESIYTLDLDALKAAKPDIILTQQLCDVCAVTGTDLQKALGALGISPTIVEQTPKDIAGIFEDMKALGDLLGTRHRTDRAVDEAFDRLVEVGRKVHGRPRIKVYAMEWLDPPYAAGHWVPEQAEFAGIIEALGRRGEKSRRVEWTDVQAADPDCIVLMPCGYDAAKAAQAVAEIKDRDEWKSLRAVRENRVWSVDANAYFSRPGPRVVDGAELLAHIFHAVEWKGPRDAYRKL